MDEIIEKVGEFGRFQYKVISTKHLIYLYMAHLY